MSGANIEELQQTVAKALEAKGVLSKLRAELRKHVFEVMEEQEKNDGKNSGSLAAANKVSELMESKEGQMAASLVVDFLKACHLDHTLSVLNSEANLTNSELIMDKEDLASAMKCTAPSDSPLIMSCFKGEGNSESLAKTFSNEKLSTALSTAAPAANEPEAPLAENPPEKKIPERSSPLSNLPSLGTTKRMGGLPSLNPIGKPSKTLAPLKAATKPDKAPLAPPSKPEPSPAVKQGELNAPPAKKPEEDVDDFDDDIDDDLEIDVDGEEDWDAGQYQGDDYVQEKNSNPLEADEIVKNENDALKGYYHTERAELELA